MTTETATTRRYYAFCHTYGASMTDQDGHDIGTLYVFATKAERDDFVDEAESRQPYITASGYVEAISARRAYRNMERDFIGGRWQRVPPPLGAV